MCATAALVLPAAPASASDIPPPAGTKRCPAPYTGGFILWIDTKVTGYHEEWFCIPGGPGAATQSESDASSLRAGVTRCGAAGHYIVWYYDLNNDYHELWNSCI
jgi:hypothetical protein